MKRDIWLNMAFVAIGIPVGIGSCMIVSDNIAAVRSDRLDAVGGVEIYKRQRVERLERLRTIASEIEDPVLRQKEIDAIERQIAEIDAKIT